MFMMSWFQLFVTLGTRLLESLLAMADEDLVEIAKSQDTKGRKAFEVLVERHNQWLTRLVRSLVSHPQDAEELVQNTLVRAFFALPNFRGDSSFKTWLRTIASREAYNHYRKHGRRKQEVASEFVDEAPDELLFDSAERLDEREHLEMALARVPYPYKEILVLRYVEELSIEEIGASLELGKSATKMRLMRAREFFKTAYDEHLPSTS